MSFVRGEVNEKKKIVDADDKLDTENQQRTDNRGDGQQTVQMKHCDRFTQPSDTNDHRA